MTTKQTRISQALADAGQSPPQDIQPAPDGGKKRSSTPSPEFQEARCKRDIRLLNERRASLHATYEEKMEKLDRELAKLNAELADVQKRLGNGG